MNMIQLNGYYNNDQQMYLKPFHDTLKQLDSGEKMKVWNGLKTIGVICYVGLVTCLLKLK